MLEQVCVIVVELTEDCMALMFDAAEVVLAVWISAFGEVVEGPKLGIEVINIVDGCDALGYPPVSFRLSFAGSGFLLLMSKVLTCSGIFLKSLSIGQAKSAGQRSKCADQVRSLFGLFCR